MHNKQNRILAAFTAIAATLHVPFSRVKQAKLDVLRKTGTVVEGTGQYRQVCPLGAGHGPGSHTMEQRVTVGSRAFSRRQHRFIKELCFHPFGKNFK